MTTKQASQAPANFSIAGRTNPLGFVKSSAGAELETCHSVDLSFRDFNVTIYRITGISTPVDFWCEQFGVLISRADLVAAARKRSSKVERAGEFRGVLA